MSRTAASRRPTDHLVRGSAFLMAATLTASAFGFAFWLVAARLYSPGEIGIASTLISATTLIAYLSLLGLNNSLIRYLPLSKNRDAEVTQSILVTVGGALLVATVYVVVAPLVAPRLVLLSDSPAHSFFFVILTAAAAANLLTDSAFIALRGAKYNLLVDGIVQSLIKLALVAPLVVLAAFGLYVAYGLSAVVAVVLSVALLCRVMGLRPRLGRPGTLRGYLGYSGGTYVSACLNLLPILAIPLIVLNEQGAEEAGYYFVAFQIATLLNSISFAICESAFAEGAHDAGQLGSVARRSAKLAFTAQTAGALVTAIAAPYVLGFFGSSYSDNATELLIVLAARLDRRRVQHVDEHAAEAHGERNELAHRLALRLRRRDHRRRPGPRGPRPRVDRRGVGRRQRRMRSHRAHRYHRLPPPRDAHLGERRCVRARPCTSSRLPTTILPMSVGWNRLPTAGRVPCP